MGCSPSSMAGTSAPEYGETTATAGTVATPSNEKDGNLFFCIKLRRSRLRRCSQQNGGEGSGGSGTGSGSVVANGDDMCNQALLNPLQVKGEGDYEKMSCGKKDSIVTVAALGNFTHTVVRRATGTNNNIDLWNMITQVNDV
ncbi:high affinity cAMP-specific and IBMX-insensitive 3',5'-cyclic phosphodiesterase 8-like isoform 2-T2 [Cochliomyia hominivorax]